MAYTGIFCTLLEFQYKTGANANATYIAEAYANSFVGQAESRINAETHYNWSDSYAALNADVKAILTEAASSLAATYAIGADMGSIGVTEAKARIDLLMYHYKACIDALKIQVNSDFIKEA